MMTPARGRVDAVLHAFRVRGNGYTPPRGGARFACQLGNILGNIDIRFAEVVPFGQQFCLIRLGAWVAQAKRVAGQLK